MLFFGARQSYADGITYTVSDIASGSFNAMAFTDALVTVVALGDTSNVFPNPKVSNDFDNNVSSATVTISGFGTFTLLGPGQVFDFQAGTTAGITDLGFFPGDDILDASNLAFGTYDLTTAIGPITDNIGPPGVPNPGTSFATSGGALILDIGGHPTFTATTPEPNSLILLGAGFAGLVMFRRRVA